jgi:hypothetical protein
MVYDSRFFLFAALALSFCSAIYLLLDVFLQETYLELLPVVIMQWILITVEADIPGLTDIGGGREFYQTSRNIYFGFFFLVIIVFSVLVFLSILTSLARKRVTSRLKKEEVIEEEKENKRLYKILAWLIIPVINSFLFSLLATPFGPIIAVIFLLLLAWWLYQLLKVIFLIFWRGFKVTAFITSVNALLIIPLILVLYGLPFISWTIWDLWGKIQAGSLPFEINELLLAALPILQDRSVDILSIIQLDFVFITIIATLIVGFAEGFAIVAIFSAIFRGIEVARTGHIIARSPPKVIVISKYLVLLGVWLSFSWNSFVKIMNMLVEYLNVVLPNWLTDILEQYSTLFYVIYETMIIPLSEALKEFSPIFQYLPFLLLPLYFILSGAFKFLSVTLVTPQVKERISAFFLLISTAFVLIITNILGDIYVIQDAPGFTGIRDAPSKFR